MAGVRTRVRRAWAGFVGPEATGTDDAVAVGAGLLGAAVAPALARRAGAGRFGAAALAGFAGDLAGGAYVNNTRACARWYSRPGQGDRQHLVFAALHLHPFAVAAVDRRGPGRGGRHSTGTVWATVQYGYLLAATVAIRRPGAHRRALGVALTVGGIALDGLLGPSPTAPWFAWLWYPKLLAGHAGSVRWSDGDLDPAPRS